MLRNCIRQYFYLDRMVSSKLHYVKEKDAKTEYVYYEQKTVFSKDKGNKKYQLLDVKFPDINVKKIQFYVFFDKNTVTMPRHLYTAPLRKQGRSFKEMNCRYKKAQTTIQDNKKNRLMNYGVKILQSDILKDLSPPQDINRKMNSYLIPLFTVRSKYHLTNYVGYKVNCYMRKMYKRFWKLLKYCKPQIHHYSVDKLILLKRGLATTYPKAESYELHNLIYNLASQEKLNADQIIEALYAFIV